MFVTLPAHLVSLSKMILQGRSPVYKNAIFLACSILTKENTADHCGAKGPLSHHETVKA